MFFVGVEDEVKVAMGVEDVSADEAVGGLLGNLLNALDEGFRDLVASKLNQELFIVYFLGDLVGVDSRVIVLVCLDSLGLLVCFVFWLFAMLGLGLFAMLGLGLFRIHQFNNKYV